MLRKLLLLCCFTAVLSADAQQTVELSQQPPEKVIWNILYLKDTASLTFDQVASSEKFSVQENAKSAFDPSVFNYWVKMDFVSKADEPTDWLMDFDKWTYVDVYLTDTTEIISRKKTGAYVPIRERDYPFANRNLIHVHLKPGQAYTAYVHLTTGEDYIYQPADLSVKMIQEKYFIRTERSKQNLLSFFAGIFLVMFLYNFFVYISTKEKNYLYYLGLMAILFLAVPHNFGYSVEYFSDTSYYKYYGQIDLLLSTIFGYFILSFTRSFLNVKQNFPVLNKIYSAIIIILVLLLVPGFMGAVFLAYNISSLIGLLTLAVVLIAAIRSYIRKYPSSGYFLSAYSAFIAGVAILLLKEIGVFPLNMFTEFSMQLGSSIEAVLFSFALANRINILKRENEEKQADIIRHLEENEQLQTKVNRELEQKVEERTNEINFQKKIIEQKNRGMVESIRYAKRIQEAILPEKQELHAYFPESFIMYEPKDIVSGDFYWTIERGGYVFYAIADCTGHGVPGGFMSMLAVSLINEVIIEKGMDEPADVLDMLRVKIIMALKQTGAVGENKDGMDMILFRFDRKNNMLTYAAANNPLWVVRNGELIVYPADKQPVGVNIVETSASFSQHSIPLQKGDIIYAITDGYADQFGGPKGKKFSYKRLKELLVSIAGKSMPAQHEELVRIFHEWRGDLEQVDDVTLAGIRI
ncbi:MAG: 7TM diverse intracellular signaling domain-containing protein [Bacteroidia bacterium]